MTWPTGSHWRSRAAVALFWRNKTIAAPKKTRVNSEITYPQVRVIDHEGEQLGILSSEDALQKAKDVSLDLVEVSPNAEPPVCRIMDFGKYKFENSKKKQGAKKKQRRTQVKEIKFRPRTEVGDYKVKLSKLTKFLENGDKTKVTMRFRGREFAHQELGMELLQRVVADLDEIANVEQMPGMEGRQMVMVLGPKKTK
ncbi:MAG TPA: translation initiation factor IF-3 [Gammaproteobacteria bacterium]|nr:translation initiation factor IF-3 [Gammaproteobacteria bacterium]